MLLYVESVRGGDRSLCHVPGVAGIAAEAPDLGVLAPRADVDVQVADASAEHVGPEPGSMARIRQ